MNMVVDELSSLLVVNYKPKFLELVRACDIQRSGNVYGDPGGEESTVWIIPNIDVLGSKEGSYVHYINRLKVPILAYELDNYLIGSEKLPEEISEKLCDELLDLKVYERMLPIELLLGGSRKENQGLLHRLLKRKQ